MNGNLAAAVRRLVAALVMIAGGLPAAFELTGHAPDAGGSLHHVEASSVRHHGDHCLFAWTASDRVAPVASPPVLAFVAHPRTVARVRVAPRPLLPQSHRPTSRAPPASA